MATATAELPTRPRDRRSKVRRLADLWGVEVAADPVCACHSPPLDFLTAWVYERPPLSLVLGPRGGGKSYLSALATHIDSLRRDRHATKILGGSLSQSQQIYNALRDFDRARPDDGVFTSFTKTAATYVTGSEVSILAASNTSVRGPHVPTLRLDEIDEIDGDIRQAAMGMVMEVDGTPASASLTSTWHRLGGPMAELIERGTAGEFPYWSFCVFDVLERCPASRSGPYVGGADAYLNCPSCPIRTWCHAERDRNGDGPPGPLAKRSGGHYAIDSLIQKTKAVSLRVFESDYLCRGPKADGLWFTGFDEATHVRPEADYDPALPVHLAVDTGVYTGAVWFQVRELYYGHTVSVFADYLVEGLGAEANARAIMDLSRSTCNGRLDRRTTDPAGGARNPIGPTTIGEYGRVGLNLGRWPIKPVADGLELVSSFVRAADGSVGLSIHPRCKHLINAFRSYRRAKRAGQWMDYPEDPQHPQEDVMDALRGGLFAEFPYGRDSDGRSKVGPTPFATYRG